VNRLYGGHLLVVNHNDEYGKVLNSVDYCCHYINQVSYLEDKLRIANEQLTEQCKANEALKIQNKEFESRIQKENKEKLIEQLKNLSFSLDESPYTYIARLENELEVVKLELANSRTREDWFKQYIRRKNVQKNGLHPSEEKINNYILSMMHS